MPCPAEASVSELPLLGVLSRVSRDWWLNCNVRVQHSAFEFSCQRVFSRRPGRRRQQAGGRGAETANRGSGESGKEGAVREKTAEGDGDCDVGIGVV
jgi:hypothetical protein